MESDNVIIVFIPMQRGMVEQMKSFYGDVLHFNVEKGRFFLNNIQTVQAQLQHSEIKIDPRKNPLFQFNIENQFPEYCLSLRHRGVRFEYVAMTPGGYMASIYDPCDNSILIGCDSFENRGNVDLSIWKEYRRY